jgi:hypothetical protein
VTDARSEAGTPDPATNWLVPFWPLLDRADPMATRCEAAQWAEGTFETLCARGLLRSAGTASRVRCPECHDHVEEVITIAGANGSRHVIPCPEHLRVEVSPQMLQRWDVDLGLVAESLAAGMGVTGKVKELVPGRLWRLGRYHLTGTGHELVLARGLTWTDGETVRSRVARCQRPIVFVPLCVPAREVWRTPPPVVRLADVVSTAGEVVAFDGMEITAAVVVAEEFARQTAPAMLSLDQLTDLIRGLLSDAVQVEPTDRIYLEAYRQEGSVRAAAKWLTQQMGRDISKDAVNRAIQRQGGAAKALKTASSNSVVRPDASQRRDKYGKRVISSQGVD